MTTIAYHHKTKTLAVDSRMTDCNGVIIFDDLDKIKVRGDKKFVCCGVWADVDPVIDAFLNEKTSKLKADGYFVENGVAFAFGSDNDGPWQYELTMDCAIGSGYIFAMAAMDFGENAVGAIEYAKTRDSATGGDVAVIELEGL